MVKNQITPLLAGSGCLLAAYPFMIITDYKFDKDMQCLLATLTLFTFGMSYIYQGRQAAISQFDDIVEGVESEEAYVEWNWTLWLGETHIMWSVICCFWYQSPCPKFNIIFFATTPLLILWVRGRIWGYAKLQLLTILQVLAFDQDIITFTMSTTKRDVINKSPSSILYGLAKTHMLIGFIVSIVSWYTQMVRILLILIPHYENAHILIPMR